jgi:hypothetical protein
MKVNTTAPTFQPVTIVLETRDELMAIAGLIGPTRAVDRAAHLRETYGLAYDRASALSLGTTKLYGTLSDLIKESAA